MQHNHLVLCAECSPHETQHCSVRGRTAPASPAGSPRDWGRWRRTRTGGPCARQHQNPSLWIPERGRPQHHRRQRTAPGRRAPAPWRPTRLLRKKRHRAMSEQRPAGPARFPRAYNPDPLPLHTRTPRQAATQGSATRCSPPLSRTKDAAHRTDPHERTNPTPTSRPLLLGFQTSPPARSANGSPGPRAHQSEAALRPDERSLSARGGARAAPGGLCAKLRPASRWPGGEDGGGDGQ